MNLPRVVAPGEWHVACESLLVKEKEATRARDALAAERRRLPLVRIEKDSGFEGPDGRADPTRTRGAVAEATCACVVAEAMGLYVDWFYGRCNRVLAPTQSVADALVERGVTTAPAVWSRGVDADHFTPLRRRPALRHALLGDGELLLLSVGRLSAEKRLDVLLSAFALARAGHPGLRLAIVGDGPARADLEKAAGQGVAFLGESHGAALADTYASADIFCFTSTTDTFGQVLLEAGASALPVVAVAAGGALDLVRPGATGLLVDPDDPTAFAAAILDLAGSEPLRRRLQTGGRQAAMERSWERSLLELRDAYRSVIERAATPRANRIAA